MKKALSKVLVLVLTVSMLISVLSVGISAVVTPYITLSSGYAGTYNYSYVTASVYGSNSGITWSLGDDPYGYAKIVSTSSDTKTIYISSVYPAYVRVTATLKDGTATQSSIVYVSSYMSSNPYFGDYGYPYYSGYPFSSNVIYVGDTAYPWCGNYSASDCTESICIHQLLKYTDYTSIYGDYTYCSSSCKWCGNPFNHHSFEWFYENGKTSSSTKSTTKDTKKSEPAVKYKSAIERLEEYLKDQEKTQETKETNTTPAKNTSGYWANLFKDVDNKAWYYNYVKFVDMNKYMKGTYNNEFGLNTVVTRGEFAEALGKFADITASKYSANFEDVSSKDSYASYAAWAVEKGFMTETSKGCFSPKQAITREEAADAIYKYVKSLKISIKDNSTIDKYSDAKDVSEAYADSVDWAVTNGIMNITGNRIKADDSLVKVRLAQMLYNLNTYIG